MQLHRYYKQDIHKSLLPLKWLLSNNTFRKGQTIDFYNHIPLPELPYTYISINQFGLVNYFPVLLCRSYSITNSDFITTLIHGQAWSLPGRIGGGPEKSVFDCSYIDYVDEYSCILTTVKAW